MKKIKTFTALSLLALILGSCKKYDADFYGPALGVAPDNFSASPLIASNSNPDFSTQTVYFQSTFSASVRWTLTIKGQTSGAIKILSGVSAFLDASNSVWNGSTDTLRLFRNGETVEARLSALGWKDTLSTTLTVAGTKDHGIVLGTFENVSVNQMSMNFQDPTGYWWYFSFEAGEKSQVDKVTDTQTPQGIHSMLFSGQDANLSYYIGQLGLSAPSSVFNFGTIGNANDVYFNFYAKGAGSAADKDYKMVVQVFEDDNANGVILYDGSEDKFVSTISLNYDGWKLFRIRYTSFTLDASAAASPYKTHTPDRIANIGFFIGANTSAGLSSSALVPGQIDYFSVTTNGPMIP